MNPPPDALPEELPREPGAAARFGERILRFFDYLTPGESPIATRSEAVASGFGAAVVRVLLSFGLSAVFVFWPVLYLAIYEWLAKVLDFSKHGGGLSGFATLALIMIEAGCFLWSVILILTDAENKWRTLNWLYFAMFAIPMFALFMCARSADGVLLILIVIAGHARVHWSLHEAAGMREAQNAEEEHAAPIAEAPVKPRPDLRNQYRGVQGFKDDGESGSG